jgi:hypothetical protein
MSGAPTANAPGSSASRQPPAASRQPPAPALLAQSRVDSCITGRQQAGQTGHPKVAVGSLGTRVEQGPRPAGRSLGPVQVRLGPGNLDSQADDRLHRNAEPLVGERQADDAAQRMPEHDDTRPGQPGAGDRGGGKLSVPEFENMFWLFAVAGNETLRNGLPGACIALLEHASAQDDLRADPWLLPGAVERVTVSRGPRDGPQPKVGPLRPAAQRPGVIDAPHRPERRKADRGGRVVVHILTGVAGAPGGTAGDLVRAA